MRPSVAPEERLPTAARPTGRYRILQVHPTRFCNLTCRHCYSESGPAERSTIDVSVLSAAISDAAALGYSMLAVSGGEPFLYSRLSTLLRTARAHGMSATVTTNGTVLTERRLGQVEGLVDLIAISLDGVPSSHNQMRGSPRAFESMAARLDLLRRTQIPFGFIFTLTLHNVHELAWVLDFADAQGAKLLQVHPLEETGRAASTLIGSSPDAVECGYAFLEAIRLQERVGRRVRIQLDLTTGSSMACQDETAPSADCTVGGHGRFADLLSPLVIEADGTAVPLTYGFPRSYSLGNIHHEPLVTLAAHWHQTCFRSFQQVCDQVQRRLASRKRIAMINWYEMVSTAAARTPRAHDCRSAESANRANSSQTRGQNA
jgi:MoaA/NifB/PqqE/SkfB family radical SAM enzyme